MLKTSHRLEALVFEVPNLINGPMTHDTDQFDQPNFVSYPAHFRLVGD
jgi:hypothetical protein